MQVLGIRDLHCVCESNMMRRLTVLHVEVKGNCMSFAKNDSTSVARIAGQSFAVALLCVLSCVAQGESQPTQVRVASISFEPVKFDLDANVQTLESWFRKAAEGGAKIAVAPEGALEGYVVDGIIAEDVDADRMWDVAVSIDSPTIKRFQNLAQELNLCLVFGFAEKVADDVFNCAVFIDQTGKICGKYHKMQLAEGYDDSWWFNRLGKQSRAFDTPFGRCGMLICNDRWNPQLARIPALDGAQFLVIPSFGSTSKSQDEAVLARAVENNLPIIEANVGVTLVVSENRIVAVDREREGITFGEITIPASGRSDADARDTVEAEFLEWRGREMPVRLAARLNRIGKIAPAIEAEQDGGVAWYDAKDIGVEGRAWDDTETYYDRLPARAKELVRPPVWLLSQHSAGMCVRFTSNAQAIHARWKLKSARLAMPHMPATGVSGLDLYVRFEGRWRWLSTGQPKEQQNTAKLIADLPEGKRDYLLYLPLYNGVTSVEIGVPNDASVWQTRVDKDRLPIVFWGTSITHGACASRPGMVHTAILGRRLERPIVNLGFSGNGRMEPEVAELMSEIDAAVYVVDCLPNITGDVVSQRVRPLVDIIRKKHSETPILLVEDRTYANAFLLAAKQNRHKTSRAALRAAYDQMQADGVPNIHFLEGVNLLGEDGEDTVDSSHPTDLGFFRQANAFEAVLRPLLTK